MAFIGQRKMLNMMKRHSKQDFEDGAAAKVMLDLRIKQLHANINNDKYSLTHARQALEMHERDLEDLLASRRLLDNTNILLEV